MEVVVSILSAREDIGNSETHRRLGCIRPPAGAGKETRHTNRNLTTIAEAAVGSLR